MVRVDVEVLISKPEMGMVKIQVMVEGLAVNVERRLAEAKGVNQKMELAKMVVPHKVDL